MNDKLEKLNQEIEKGEKKLRRLKHEEKILQNRAKQLTRNERTHRLCTRGAALESYLPHPELVTDEQVSTILKLLFHFLKRNIDCTFNMHFFIFLSAS